MILITSKIKKVIMVMSRIEMEISTITTAMAICAFLTMMTIMRK